MSTVLEAGHSPRHNAEHSDDDAEHSDAAGRAMHKELLLAPPQNLTNSNPTDAHDDDDKGAGSGGSKLKRRKRSKKIITFAEGGDSYLPDDGDRLTRTTTMERLTGVHKAKVRRHLSKKHASFTTPEQLASDTKKASRAPLLKAKPSVVITP